MQKVALFEAKNRLSELVDRVLAGESIAITRRGKIVARLVSNEESVAAEEQDPVARLRKARHGVKLRGLSVRDLIAEGRR